MSELIENAHTSSCEVPLFLSHVNETWNFLHRFSKNSQISSFLKIRPVGAELFHVDGRTDGQTDMTKLIIALRISANAPRKST